MTIAKFQWQVFLKGLVYLLPFFVVKVVSERESVVGNCLVDDDCEQCKVENVVWGSLGQRLCCEGCKESPFLGKNASCVCLEDPENGPGLSSRIIFQGSKDDAPVKQNSFIRENSTPFPSKPDLALGQALSLLADAVEKIDIRLGIVENSLAQLNQLRQASRPVRLEPDVSESIRHVSHESLITPCQKGFAKVGPLCFYASIYENKRLNWKDARKACNEMGAILAEVSTHSDFVALSSYLTSTPLTSRHRYWVGGVYPGATWIWVSSGRIVTMNSTYWTLARQKMSQTNDPVIAGDIKGGRCLGFHPSHSGRGFGIASDECGFERFYLCQMNSRKQ